MNLTLPSLGPGSAQELQNGIQKGSSFFLFCHRAVAVIITTQIVR